MPLSILFRSQRSVRFTHCPSPLSLFCDDHLSSFTHFSTSFLSTNRRLLHFLSPTGSEAGGTSDGPSGPPSPQGISSPSSSSLPSPVEASGGPGNQTWSPDSDLSPSGAANRQSAPSPITLHDASSQDTQSSGERFSPCLYT